MNIKNTALSALAALAVAVTAALFLFSNASAGEYFEKDGVALRGHDPVAYFSENKPVKGLPEHKAEHQSSTFYFASKANRDAFVADPTRYAPQYGGFCAFGMASGYKAATDPAAFSIVEGKLYLNYNRDIQKQWNADRPGFIAKAEKNWPATSKQTKVIE